MLAAKSIEGDGERAFQRWHVRLFSHLHLIQDNQIVVRFRTRKAGALLAYLALHIGVPQSREVLTEIIWPDSNPSAARANLRFVLSTLRRDMEPAGVPPGSVLRADNSSVELRRDAVTTDVKDFERLLAASVATGAASPDTDERREYLQQAVGLYRGDLLLGYYEEWASLEREQLREQYRGALLSLIQLLQDCGEFDAALHHAATVLALDPLNEGSHTTLIRLHLATGDTGSALRQYRKMERTLRDEINEVPSASARALLRAIRSSPSSAALPETGGAEDANTLSEVLSRGAGSRVGAASSFVLPIPLTQFFDRPECAEALEVLQSGRSRLLTVTGAAGAGKTRLAIQTARQLKNIFGEAIWFLPASEYSSGERLADAIFDALALSRSPVIDPAEQIVEALGRQPSLLILDAFEHLAENGSGIITDLLQRAPTLTCLVTSRVHLRLAAGAVIPVPPLPVPERNGTLAQLQENPSFQLLLDRVRLVCPTFVPTPVHILEMAELCRRLEGLPLSIELAAPWMQILSPTEILQRLDDPFTLLVSDSGDIPERHRSLHNAIQSSCTLLSLQTQNFFRRLSIFEGGFTLDVVSSVLDEPTAPSYLRELRECSLIHVVERGPKTHFYLLDVVRTYAWSLLPQEERDSLAQRHAACYLFLGFEAESHMGGAAREEWLEELEFRVPNFRRALDWFILANPAQYLFLTSALWMFWYLRNHIHEGRTHLQQALVMAVDLPGSETAAAKAALGLACLTYAQGDSEQGRSLLQQSMEGFRGLRRPGGTAAYLSGLARFASFRGDYELTGILLDEALFLWRLSLQSAARAEVPAKVQGPVLFSIPAEANVRWEIADTIRRSGDVAYCQGDLPEADAKFEESLALFRDLHHGSGIAAAHTGLGVVARAQGNYDTARSHLNQAYHIRLRQEDWRGVVTSQRILADIACREGRFQDARILLGELMATLRLHANFQGMTGAITTEGIVTLCEGETGQALHRLREALEMGAQREDSRRIAYIRCFLALATLAAQDTAEATEQTLKSLRWFYEAGDQCGLALSLEVCAATAAQKRDGERAAHLIGAAKALRESLGAPVPPTYLALFEHYLAHARTRLGEATFRTAQETGASLPLYDVVSLASLLAP